MTAWFEQMTHIVARDTSEHGAWLRYWITISSPKGTRETTIAWQRAVAERARAGSEVAARVMESVRQRDRAMKSIDLATTPPGPIEVRVPDVVETPPADDPGPATGRSR